MNENNIEKEKNKKERYKYGIKEPKVIQVDLGLCQEIDVDPVMFFVLETYYKDVLEFMYALGGYAYQAQVQRFLVNQKEINEKTARAEITEMDESLNLLDKGEISIFNFLLLKGTALKYINKNKNNTKIKPPKGDLLYKSAALAEYFLANNNLKTSCINKANKDKLENLYDHMINMNGITKAINEKLESTNSTGKLQSSKYPNLVPALDRALKSELVELDAGNDVLRRTVKEVVPSASEKAVTNFLEKYIENTKTNNWAINEGINVDDIEKYVKKVNEYKKKVATGKDLFSMVSIGKDFVYLNDYELINYKNGHEIILDFVVIDNASSKGEANNIFATIKNRIDRHLEELYDLLSVMESKKTAINRHEFLVENFIRYNVTVIAPSQARADVVRNILKVKKQRSDENLRKFSNTNITKHKFVFSNTLKTIDTIAEATYYDGDSGEKLDEFFYKYRQKETVHFLNEFKVVAYDLKKYRMYGSNLDGVETDLTKESEGTKELDKILAKAEAKKDNQVYEKNTGDR